MIKPSKNRDSTEIFEYKQVIILRSDIKMSQGKAAVQASHAAVSASEKARKENLSWWRRWMDEGQRKIVLKVSSGDDLLKIKRDAEKLNLPTSLISDMGLTELEPGTVTALGIGPAPSNLLDKITGSLPLY
ncbi:MAG: peptidyl-tRNA hydrolase Pth2 [Candidatus Bathyarchaeia archaeon]